MVPNATVTQLSEKWQLALALHESGQLTQAQAAYEEILTVQPGHPDAINLLGAIAIQTGNAQRAVELYGRAIEIDPSNVVARCNSALAYGQLGQLRSALEQYDQAIALKPEIAETHFNRGNILRNLGQFDAALASYQQAIELESDYAEAHLSSGDVLRELKQYERALASYEQAIASVTDYEEAHMRRGALLHELNQQEMALASYERAIALKPDYAKAHFSRGNALAELKRWEAALASYEQVIALQPHDAPAYSNRGLVLKELGQLEAALASLNQAIALKPDYAEAHSNRGIVLTDLKRADEALASFNQAIALEPDYATAYSNRGIVFRELGQFDAALASSERAIALKPDYAAAYSNRGTVLHELKQWNAALASYNQAIALKVDYAEAYFNRGIVLHELQQWDAALASYNQAIALKADFAEAYCNRGIVLRELKRLDEALASLNRAVALKSDYAEAYSNRGFVLHELQQWEAALASCNQAIALKADFAEAYSNRGLVLHELQQWEAALASYNRAIALKADFAEAYLNRGNALKKQGLEDEALTSYAHALALKPDHPWLYGTWLHTKMHLCDWQGLEAAVAHLASKVERTQRTAQPYEVLTFVDSAQLQQRAAEVWAQETCPASLALTPIDRRPRAGQIRLGYYSADFHNSAMAHLMVKLFERHDRQRFHVIAFSFGPDAQDMMRKRLSAAFAEFIDVRARSQRQIAQLSRELGIDIAVDLMGFTRNQRPEIFAYRAAPVQVSYLGYPGTMSTSCIDYLFADRVVIPDDNRRHYAEKVVYLPNSYFPTSYQVDECAGRNADPESLRAELGLPPVGFVFCCFNNRYKITPGVFDIWMRLLRQVEGSVLWLLQDGQTAARNLRKEAQARGVSEARLIFAPRTSPAQHLVRHRAADLFLDTLPYNAHTTASDALWSGVPVLTRVGESFAARVAASQLNAVGLPELITTTAEQYEATAIDLATDPERLARIQGKLNKDRLTTSLFDSELLTRHLEQAYVQLYERYHQGLASQDIDMSPQASSGH